MATYKTISDQQTKTTAESFEQGDKLEQPRASDYRPQTSSLESSLEGEKPSQ